MTCACRDGKLCAEHLGAWLDRLPSCSECGGVFGHTGHCMQHPAKSWRSFPAEPTCERCIVKVEGGFVMQRCDACQEGTPDGRNGPRSDERASTHGEVAGDGDNTEGAPANALAELPTNGSHD